MVDNTTIESVLKANTIEVKDLMNIVLQVWKTNDVLDLDTINTPNHYNFTDETTGHKYVIHYSISGNAKVGEINIVRTTFEFLGNVYKIPSRFNNSLVFKAKLSSFGKKKWGEIEYKSKDPLYKQFEKKVITNYS